MDNASPQTAINHRFRYYGKVLANDLSGHNPFYSKSTDMQWNGNPGTEGLRIIPKVKDMTDKKVDAEKIRPSTFGKTKNHEENQVVHNHNVMTATNNTGTK